MTWCDDKIYIIGFYSKRVHVFSDTKPFEKFEYDHEIIGISNPVDMVASRASQSILISDGEGQSFWRIKISDGKIKNCKLNGRPHGLSITTSDELIVVVNNSLSFYRLSDLKLSKSMVLPIKVEDSESEYASHAVELPNGNVIIAYKTKSELIIGELSSDGSNLCRKYALPRPEGDFTPKSFFVHVSIIDDNKIIIADPYSGFYMGSPKNSQLCKIRTTLKDSVHQVENPTRICYIRDKQQLIVGQGFGEASPLIYVLSIDPLALSNKI